jgi:DNA-binding NarL/FixJ family response regulator
VYAATLLLISTFSVNMLRIIIADDHPVLLQAVKKMIQEEFPNAEIGEALNASTLLEKVFKQEWDLVITDMAMPGGGGFMALKKIKQFNKNLPVLIISTYPAEQYRNNAIKAGAEDFISKEVFPGELVSAIHRIVDKISPAK